MPADCDLILLCWNELAHTRRCVESLLQHTDVPSRLLIVDNGSDQETADFLQRLRLADAAPLTPPGARIRPAGGIQEIRLLRNERNEGYARGMNRGLRESSARWVCLLNNDIVVTAGWLREMISVMENEPRLGILNPASNNFGMAAPEKGAARRSGAARQQGLVVRRPPAAAARRWIETNGCSGFCFLIRRSVLDQVGLFDEQFKRGYFEDADYSMRVRAAGYDCGIALGCYVSHVGGASFQRVSNRNEVFHQNEQRFYQKWPKPRPQRIAWILADFKGHSAAEIREQIRRVANDDHQVRIYHTRRTREAVPAHHRVVARELPETLFYPAVLWHILTKKKKFHRIILCARPKIGRWLERLRAAECR